MATVKKFLRVVLKRASKLNIAIASPSHAERVGENNNYSVSTLLDVRKVIRVSNELLGNATVSSALNDVQNEDAEERDNVQRLKQFNADLDQQLVVAQNRNSVLTQQVRNRI